jgi:hypothetical protein
MLREKSKWRTHKDESTDAEHRGGLPRISDEATVMDVNDNLKMTTCDHRKLTTLN